jgi:hypothetical protein
VVSDPLLSKPASPVGAGAKRRRLALSKPVSIKAPIDLSAISIAASISSAMIVEVDGHSHIVPADSGGIFFGRTSQQVLNLAYETPGSGVSKGGFFPMEQPAKSR